ncbi:5'/3'-nucleotidase SurE [bacterium]|nr:5'/3'-nucleotidase SurE [bacterium]
MLRVLLTNDDGIQAEGLRRLAAHLATRAEVLVVAPEVPHNAASHSITLHKPLRLTEQKDFGADVGARPGSIKAYSCSGSPSDCVMLAVLHLAPDPPLNLVISGINDGINVAQDLTYSGTVGAALEGAILGIPSLAVSLDTNGKHNFDNAVLAADLVISVLLFGRFFTWHRESTEHWRKETSSPSKDGRWPLREVPVDEMEHYPDPQQWYPAGLSHVPCFNVNIPALPVGELAGIAWTVAGHREYRDVVTEAFDPRGRPYYWIAGEKILNQERPGTDTYTLGQGLVSVTPLKYDITNHGDLERMSAALKERLKSQGDRAGQDTEMKREQGITSDER